MIVVTKPNLALATVSLFAFFGIFFSKVLWVTTRGHPVYVRLGLVKNASSKRTTNGQMTTMVAGGDARNFPHDIGTDIEDHVTTVNPSDNTNLSHLSHSAIGLYTWIKDILKTTANKISTIAPHKLISHQDEGTFNLNFNILLSPSRPCSADTFLLIMVHSKATNISIRDAIRNTWGKSSKLPWPGVNPSFLAARLYFILGIPETTDTTWMRQLLREEHSKYGDLIVYDFVDSTHNATLKALMALKWASMSCSHVHFMMKVDHVMFFKINLAALYKFVTVDFRNLTNSVIGHRISDHITNDPYNKESRLSFITSAEGSMYLITNDLFLKFLKQSMQVPYTEMENWFITGLMTKLSGSRLFFEATLVD